MYINVKGCASEGLLKGEEVLRVAWGCISGEVLVDVGLLKARVEGVRGRRFEIGSEGVRGLRFEIRNEASVGYKSENYRNLGKDRSEWKLHEEEKKSRTHSLYHFSPPIRPRPFLSKPGVTKH